MKKGYYGHFPFVWSCEGHFSHHKLLVL